MNINQLLASLAKSPAQAAQAVLTVLATVGLIVGLTVPFIGSNEATEDPQDQAGEEQIYDDRSVNPTPTQPTENYVPAPFTEGFVGQNQVRVHNVNKLDEQTLAVWYEGGAAECIGHEARVLESPGRIQVRVYTGIIPGSTGDDEPCDFSSQLRVSLVKTIAPVGDRQLIF